MRRDHRPYYLKKAWLGFQSFYVDHFLRPHLESLGAGFIIIKPWHVEVFGAPVRLGAYINVVAAADRRVRLAVWPRREGAGGIRIGDYCLICPGVRIGSARQIVVGDNCMLASGVYITDCDWHDAYNRLATGKSQPVRIENNVWIGDSAIICKGVTIGENSIIGAGSVVVTSVPANCVAAGNPARVVKQLDPGEKFVTRQQWYTDPAKLFADLDAIDRQHLQPNSLWHWLRYLLFPARGD